VEQSAKADRTGGLSPERAGGDAARGVCLGGTRAARASAVTPPEPFSKRRRMDAITVEQVAQAAGELLEG